MDINGARDQAQTQAQVAQFMAAIEPREDMYPDLDKVALHGNAPVTPRLPGPAPGAIRGNCKNAAATGALGDSADRKRWRRGHQPYPQVIAVPDLH